ncbi:MAG: sigma-54 dependent transcriptional regulator [Thermoanaerobaculales bacterium]|jgi:two-component system NtrC family response regulator|nr:sigma-54 dependent transcriptional regulator [Thermoanaerobaculales bacterium]
MPEPGPAVLVVEDEAPQRRLIVEILERAGYQLRAAATVDEALEAIREAVPDLVLCDWRMPGRDGGQLLAEVRRLGLGCGFIVMTAYGSIAHAVEAIRLGADDYLGKPFEREALLLAVQRVLRTRRLERENRRLREAVDQGAGAASLIGESPVMQRLYRTIAKVAASDATVLVLGESGTGKELVARTLHRSSHRADRSFVAVNCAAIPETLIESELFGHEKGAFTGAHRRRAGKFEEADGGTLFLDEIASMPLPLQATLLRVLQERRITPLGGRGETEVDVRVVAASNRDLPRLVREGQFREDLYYRLNVVPIELPPLRDRRDDVPLLATAFLERAAARHGREVGPLPRAILHRLVEHGWPGNVRELANAIERLVLLAEDGVLSEGDLPAAVRGGEHVAGTAIRLPAGGLDWEAMEESLLRQALERSGGNRAAAARLLGLGYKAFLYRLDKHGLAGEPEASG